jgi:hypothetical protein
MATVTGYWPPPRPGLQPRAMQGEGFEEVATCDRLLGDLDRGQEQLDGRTILVVDEVGTPPRDPCGLPGWLSTLLLVALGGVLRLEVLTGTSRR